MSQKNPPGSTHHLRKLILWGLVQEMDKDVCFRCGERIKDMDDLSIEHKTPWQSAPDPKASFFDLTNIAFSHLGCNAAAGGPTTNINKEFCPQGHPYSGDNLYVRPDGHRDCRACHNQSQLAYAQRKRAS